MKLILKFNCYFKAHFFKINYVNEWNEFRRYWEQEDALFSTITIANNRSSEKHVGIVELMTSFLEVGQKDAM